MHLNESTKFFPLEVLIPSSLKHNEKFIHQLETNLSVEEELEKVHISQSDNGKGLCIHYNPDKITLQKVEHLVKMAGIDLSHHYKSQTLYLNHLETPQSVQLIEDHLRALPGLLAVRVSYSGQMAVVEYDTNKIDLPKIQSSLKDLGFENSIQQHTPSIYDKYKEVITSLSAGVFLLIGWSLGKFNATLPTWISFLFTLISILIGGLITLKHSLHVLGHKKLDTDVLMLLAAIGAAALGAWNEGALLLFLFSLGHALEHLAMNKTRQAVKALGKYLPKTAQVLRNQNEITVPVEQILIDDSIRVYPNQRIPVDGLITKGHSFIDQSSITGESIPIEKSTQDEVFAGTINGQGELTVKVTKRSEDTLISRMVKLVLEADSQKARVQRLTERFQRYYVPIVFLGVTLLIFIPPLLLNHAWAQSFYRAMAVLVAMSPCALAIGTPVTILATLAKGAQNGILFKGGQHIESLAEVCAVAFDKTGTLTKGRPEVQEIKAFAPFTTHQVLQLSASLENNAQHPLGKAIVNKAIENGIKLITIEEVESIVGQGVRGRYQNKILTIGNAKLFQEYDIPHELDQQMNHFLNEGLSVVILNYDNKWMGLIALSDAPRDEAKLTIENLKKMGIHHTIMLTGDHRHVANLMAKSIGITNVMAQLLPEDKVASIRKLEKTHHKVCMVGDGVNDALAMSHASVGVAMGEHGTDVALEVCDIALMKDDLSKLTYAIRLGRSAKKIIIQNIALSMGVVLVLAYMTLTGQVGIGPSVLFHEGSSLLVVLNGLRMFRVK